MEWVLIGLLAWWWCSRRQRADRVSTQLQRNASNHSPSIHFATPIAVVDDHGYWLAEGRLVRAPFTQGVLDADRVEDADTGRMVFRLWDAKQPLVHDAIGLRSPPPGWQSVDSPA